MNGQRMGGASDVPAEISYSKTASLCIGRAVLLTLIEVMNLLLFAAEYGENLLPLRVISVQHGGAP